MVVSIYLSLDGLMQKRRSSSALAMELRLICIINPSFSHGEIKILYFDTVCIHSECKTYPCVAYIPSWKPWNPYIPQSVSVWYVLGNTNIASSVFLDCGEWTGTYHVHSANHNDPIGIGLGNVLITTLTFNTLKLTLHQIADILQTTPSFRMLLQFYRSLFLGEPQDIKMFIYI